MSALPRGRRRRAAVPNVAAAVVVTTMAACAWVPGQGPAQAGPTDPDTALVPAGYGTLRQDEVTLSLRRDDLLIKITPLDEGVIRLTAPDTYDRLAELKEGHRGALRRRASVDEPALFLVSLFSYEPNIPFQPEDVHLVNQGIRMRPLAIRPVTPRWGVQRLSQEETQMAVYAYDAGIDLEQELSVEYQDVRRGGWDRILQVIQAERARVRARARSDPEGG